MTCHWGDPDLYVYKKKNIQDCRNSSRIQHKFVERDKINTLNMSAHFSCFFFTEITIQKDEAEPVISAQTSLLSQK